MSQLGNQFAIDRRNGVLLVKFAGELTLESLNAFNAALAGVVEHEKPTAAVIDLTGISSDGVKSSTLSSQGKMPTLMPGKPRVFVVNDPAMYGLLRIYAAHQEVSGQTSPMIVRSLTEAFQGLALVDPSFEPVTGGTAR